MIERLIAVFTAIPTLIIAAIYLLFILITGFFVSVASGLLEWIISPNFISLSYTKPCLAINNYQPTGSADTCNPVIGLGLDTIQQFVNMLLVLILIYIALSIALRAGGGKAEKLFPQLIIVALLVNFAPVFIGLVVDAANILMNYFLTPLQGGFSQIGAQLSVFWDAIVKNFSKIWSDLPSQMTLLGMGSVIVFVNITVATILFLFAGILFVRFIAIWVIVILSPLAFVFSILPQTNNLYKMWEKQLVQWSFVGIPIAFFMYLGVSSLSVLTQNFNAASIQAPNLNSSVSQLLSQLLPYFTVVIFLVIGLFVGISMSAMGANAVVKGMGKGAAAVGNWSKGKIGDLGNRVRQGAKNRAGQFTFAQRQSMNAGRTKLQAFTSGTMAAAGWTHSKQKSTGMVYRAARKTGYGKLRAAWATTAATTGLNRGINTALRGQIKLQAYKKGLAQGMTKKQAVKYAQQYTALLQKLPQKRKDSAKKAFKKGAGTILWRAPMAVTRGMSGAILLALKEIYKELSKKKKTKKTKKKP
ncbi:MAG: hypothetical protein UR98_C0002G0043 [Parcubacteria group bacterium GW2011_GWA1_36_12]|nr:MAG: hypothetical protein UR98_C0002G0043 [Parcubacteria group bacterium GW2011_GWA1_36_12]